MRATGIVRRIDELGRVVIPKEIRRTLRIREGDPMEIFLSSDGELMLKKYSPVGVVEGLAKDYATTLHRTTEFGITICDKDAVIVTVGTGRGLTDQTISENVLTKISDRKTFVAWRLNNEYPVPIIEGGSPEGYAIQIIVPLIIDGETAGAIIATLDHLILLPAPVIDATTKMVEAFAQLMGRQIEA